MSKRYTEDEIKFIKDNWKIMTDEQMALKLQRTEKSIRKYRNQVLKLYRNLSGKISIDQLKYNDLIIKDDLYVNDNLLWTINEDLFLKNNYKNMNDEEIGNLLGRTRYAVKRRRYLLNLKKKDYPDFHTYDEVKEKFKERNYTLISKYYKNTNQKLEYTCNIHKDEGILTITLRDFLCGKGCRFCGQEHLTENKVYQILKNLKLNVEREKSFEDCVYINKLRFDFYLNDYNILIEYDGEEHYKPISFSGDKEKAKIDYELVKKRDLIKNEYCLNNNIPLIRIPYYEKDNLILYIKSELLKYNIVL